MIFFLFLEGEGSGARGGAKGGNRGGGGKSALEGTFFHRELFEFSCLQRMK